MLLCGLLNGCDSSLRCAGQLPAKFRGVYATSINGLVAGLQTGRPSALLHRLRGCNRLRRGRRDCITTCPDVTEIVAYRSYGIGDSRWRRRNIVRCNNRPGIRRRWPRFWQTRCRRQFFNRQSLFDRCGRRVGVSPFF